MIAFMASPPKHSRRHPAPPKKRPSTITIPELAGPHVKLVFAEMRRLGQTYDNVEAGSGVNRPTIKAWRHKNRPNLDSIEAVLGFLGWDFVPVPRSKVLPAEVENELRDVAARLDLTMPQTIQALVEIVTGIHGRFGSGPHAAESARTPERPTEAWLAPPADRGDPNGPAAPAAVAHSH